jgi:NMD protein affecting ribosome stability and mRNA decay
MKYTVKKITTETYVATCKVCKKEFRSDVESKAVSKIQHHIIDKHGK